MSFSIITASYNALSTIETLAKSLENQSSLDFEWIVIDGGSLDGTVEFFDEFSKRCPWCRFMSQPDFGVYDAINKGIKLMSFDYYLPVGADDYLYADTARVVNEYLTDDDFDILLMDVNKGGIVSGGFKPRNAWLGHSFVFGGSHSVGMLIRKSLHNTLGFYSNRFPILADGYFLKKALSSPSVKFKDIRYVSGFFSTSGMSNSVKLQTLAETWQIQMLTEKNKLLQIVLFFAKILVRISYLIR